MSAQSIEIHETSLLSLNNRSHTLKKADPKIKDGVHGLNPEKLYSTDSLIEKINPEMLCESVCSSSSLDLYRLKYEKMSYLIEFHQASSEEAFKDPKFLLALLNLKSIRGIFTDEILGLMKIINSNEVESNFFSIDKMFWTAIGNMGKNIDSSKKLATQAKLYEELLRACSVESDLMKKNCLDLINF
ncbi:MAG: hypothetical protein K2Q18_14560 [Bdellovibrionales bacterium]|nr:hypothetical protein [Bdellovibrionales bacterium]